MPTFRFLPIPNFKIDTKTASVPLPFLVTGTDNLDEIVELAIANSVPVYGNIVRDAIEADHQGGQVWLGRINYSTKDRQQALSESAPEPAAPGPSETLTNQNGGGALSFSALGEVTHITQSVRTIDRRGPSDPVDTGTNLTMDGANAFKVTPDAHTPDADDVHRTVVVTGGTGWTKGAYEITAQGGGQWTLDGTPAALGASGGIWELTTAPSWGQAIQKGAGCDVGGAGGLEFTVDVQRDVVNMFYLLTIFALRNTVNYGAPFWGTNFPPGTVRYGGATGKFSNGTRWDISHKFYFNANRTNVACGNFITLPSVRGWDYVWFLLADDDKTTDTFSGLVKKPVAAYVEQVYEEGDLSLLGVG